MTKIKICAITSPEEIEHCVRSHVDALGFVFENLTGTGVIPMKRIAELVTHVPPSMESVLLTGSTAAEDLLRECRASKATTVQLCRPVPAAELQRLRRDAPKLRLVHVVHVVGEAAYAEAVRAASEVDAILLDSISIHDGVPQLGATGRVHDWPLSRRIVEAVSVPLYLAGGLTALNVGEALSTVRPFGVDVCSGVRMEGRVDQVKLEAFVAAVRASDGAVG